MHGWSCRSGGCAPPPCRAPTHGRARARTGAVPLTFPPLRHSAAPHSGAATFAGRARPPLRWPGNGRRAWPYGHVAPVPRRRIAVGRIGRSPTSAAHGRRPPTPIPRRMPARTLPARHATGPARHRRAHRRPAAPPARCSVMSPAGALVPSHAMPPPGPDHAARHGSDENHRTRRPTCGCGSGAFAPHFACWVGPRRATNLVHSARARQ